MPLLTRLRLKTLISLSLINGSLPSVLYSLCSLLISKPLLFILKQILLFLYIKTVAGCCCYRLTAHLTPSSSLHGSSQALSLGCLVSDQVKKNFPFHPSFSVFCVCDMGLSFCSNDLFFDL